MNRPGLLLAGSAILLLLFTLFCLLSPERNILLWLMQALPLLVTLPGQRRAERRALQWLGFLLLFYFVNGILQAFNAVPILRMLAFAQVLTSLVMFVTVLLILKRPSRHLRGD